MPFGENIQIDEEIDDAKNSPAPAGGRGLDYERDIAAKSNIDDELEKNLLIRVMPRKFKVSVSNPVKTKTKAVGAVIMIVGLLVMGAAVYLVYAFLINPKKVETPNPIQRPVTPAPATDKKEDVKKPEEKSATTTPKVNPSANNSVPSSTTPVVAKPATSTPAVSPAATSTAPVATSTPDIGGGATLDTDQDGLSDAEEVLYGTNSALADSDGDGYSDKAEVDGLYNPAGPGRLAANLNISQYKEAQNRYSVFYPNRWRVQVVGDSVIFSSPDNSFVQIVAEQNPDKKTILTWYNEQFTDAPAILADVVIKNGWEGIYHQDKEIFYLTDAAKKNIYTISYVPAKEGDMIYYHIFQMMIASFALEAK